MKTLFKNGLILIDNEFRYAHILVEDSNILAISHSLDDLKDFDKEEDLAGKRLIPGFIDIHTHGAVGVDVNAATADEYEKIDSSNYSINYDTSTITMTEDMSSIYDELIVEYKKKDSYAINYNKITDMYEIDVSTNQLDVLVHYDSHEDGHINSYINTSIYPNGNQYVILREAKE